MPSSSSTRDVTRSSQNKPSSYSVSLFYWFAFVIDWAVLSNLVFCDVLASPIVIHSNSVSAAVAVFYNSTIVTISVVILPSMLVFYLLGRWLDALANRDDRPRTRSMIVAGRLGAVLAPVLWMLLAAFSPWSGPVLLAALALPLVSMGLQVTLGYPVLRWAATSQSRGPGMKRVANWLLGPKLSISAVQQVSSHDEFNNSVQGTVALDATGRIPVGVTDHPSRAGGVRSMLPLSQHHSPIFNAATLGEEALNSYITQQGGQVACEADLDQALFYAVKFYQDCPEGRFPANGQIYCLSDVMNHLLRAGANPMKYYGKESTSAFHSALRNGRDDVAQIMIEAHGRPEVWLSHLNGQGRNIVAEILSQDASAMDLDVLGLLLAMAAEEPDQKVFNEYLSEICKHGDEETDDLKEILDHSLVRCLESETLNKDAILRLLKAGADPIESNRHNGFTVLHLAVARDDDFLCKLLDLPYQGEHACNVGLFQLENRLNIVNNESQSPLELAIVLRKAAHIHHLVMAGADLSVISKDLKAQAVGLVKATKSQYIESVTKLGVVADASERKEGPSALVHHSVFNREGCDLDAVPAADDDLDYA